MHEEQSYVIADGSGACRYATAAAMELLGIEPSALSQLRVDDLSRPALVADPLRRQVQASARCIGRWLTGAVELSRSDGSVVAVRFALIRRSTGEIVVRLDTERSDAGPQVRVRDVLEAWRRQEQAAAGTPAGTPEHLLAEVEVERLSAAYQRLAIDRAREIADER